MAKFVKYLSKAHLNSMNVAVYESGAVRAESVVNGKSIGARQFDSVEDAEEWFGSLPGNDMGRLSSAIEALDSRASDQ